MSDLKDRVKLGLAAADLAINFATNQGMLNAEQQFSSHQEQRIEQSLEQMRRGIEADARIRASQSELQYDPRRK